MTYAGKKRKKMRKFRIDFLSSVDRGAQAAQGDAFTKRDGETPMLKRFEKRTAMTTVNEGHQHLVMLDHGNGEMTSGRTDWVNDHDHPWLMTGEGIVLGAGRATHDSVTHTHQVAVFSKDSTEGGESAASSDGTGSADATADPFGKETGMTKTEGQGAATDTKAADAVQKAEHERDAALAKSDRLSAIVALPSDQRAHFDGLNTEGQDAFLKLDADHRAEALREADAADKVVYKADDGRVFRKSDDQNLVAEVKRNDDLAKRLAASEAIAEQASLEKRAGDDLKNLKGTVSAKAMLLRKIDEIADEDLRKECEEILKSHNLAMGGVTVTKGTSKAPEGATDAETKINELAKRHSAEKDISFEQAVTEVVATPEGSRLYAEMVANDR